jgi:putative ABC transport system substrate-binding protein
MQKMKILRSLLAILLLAGVFLPEPAAAEKLVAAIVTGDLPRYQQANAALEAIIRSAGYDVDKLKIFTQTPNPDTMSLTNSIRRSLAAGAELLITYGASATLVAAKEAGEIPILFADVYDPQTLGIVQNMAAPGVNRSGASSKIPATPLLEKLQAIKPGTRIGVLFNETEPGSKQQSADLETAGKSLGLSLSSASARNPAELDKALEDLQAKADVLFIAESVVINQQIDKVMTFAAAQGLPVISMIPGLADLGALLTFEASPEEQGKLAAVHTLQVLAGQKAFMLPVREPRQINLVVNLKTAETLKLQVPEAVLKSATRVVR